MIFQKYGVIVCGDCTDSVPQVREAVGTSAEDLPAEATGILVARYGVAEVQASGGSTGIAGAQCSRVE